MLRKTSVPKWLFAGVTTLMIPAWTPTSSATDNKTLLVGVDETGIEYWSEFMQGAREIASSAGVKTSVLVSNYNGEQLLSQLGASLATGCTGCSMTIDPSSNAFTKAVVTRAAKAKIPVVTVWNRPEEIHPWDTGSGSWIAHISFDGDESGYLQGMALCKALNGKGKIAAIKGFPATPPAYQRIRGLRKALKACPGLELLDVQAADWNDGKAANITRTWLARFGGNLQGIMASSDAMAYGAVQALKEKGLNGKIIVVSSDGSTTGLQMVKDGDLYADVWNDPKLQGAVSGAMAYAAAVGDIKVDRLSYAQRDFNMKQFLVTKENVDQYLALKKHAPTYTYDQIKADFWKYSAGPIKAGANVDN